MILQSGLASPSLIPWGVKTSTYLHRRQWICRYSAKSSWFKQVGSFEILCIWDNLWSFKASFSNRKVTFIDRGRSTVEFEYITYMKYRKIVIINYYHLKLQKKWLSKRDYLTKKCKTRCKCSQMGLFPI